MLLIYGTAALSLAVLIFGLTLIGSRNPQEPAWAKDLLVANVYLPVMIALAVLGAACFVKFVLSVGSQSVGIKELIGAIGITAVSLMLLKTMRIKQRLAAYDAVQKTAEIVKPDVFFNKESPSDKPEPPAKPTSGQKAA